MTTYSPEMDGEADPGEVVWAWVPYEDDPSRGKDRPVLVVGRHGGVLYALQLTSKDHDRDAAQEARAGRFWMDVGTGAWDPRGRPSEVRLNRVVALTAAGRALVDRAFEAHLANEHRLLAALEEGDRRALEGILTRWLRASGEE